MQNDCGDTITKWKLREITRKRIKYTEFLDIKAFRHEF